MAIRIHVIDSFDVYIDSIVDVLLKVPDFEMAGVARNAAEADIAAVGGADLVLIGPNISVDDGLSLTERMAKEQPHLGVILISGEMTTELLRQGLRVGLRDIVSASAKPEELYDAVRRAHGASQRLVQAVGAVPVEAEAAPTQARGKIVTFFSTKGGVGKTVFAVNTAVSLVQQKKGPVVLVDLDLQFGDVGVMLRLLPKRTVYDAVQAIGRLDAEMIQGFLTPHESGLNVLLAPPDPEQSMRVPAEHLPLILELLRETHDYVIVDTPASFGEQVLVALDRSDEVYLVGTLDVPSTKNVKLALETLVNLQYPKEAIQVVLNRADSRVGLQPQEVQKALKHTISASIPSDRLVPLSVNRGVPVVTAAPRSPVARSISQLAELVAERAEACAVVSTTRGAR